MMKPQLRTPLLQLLISLIPLSYLFLIWNQLPEIVPMHYNIHNQPDRMGSKLELFFLILFMTCMGYGVGMLMRYLSKIDPKKEVQHNAGLMEKISWTVVIFISVLSAYLIFETLQFDKKSGAGPSSKFISILITLVFVVLGNLMNNIKPNYFVGIRTPWNLENPENWRKTHHLGAKLMFFGGILIGLLVLVLPEWLAFYVLLIGLIPIVLIPFVYSYLLFKREKQ